VFFRIITVELRNESEKDAPDKLLASHVRSRGPLPQKFDHDRLATTKYRGRELGEARPRGRSMPCSFASFDERSNAGPALRPLIVASESGFLPGATP